MSINNDEETQIDSEFNKLNISINHKNCYQPYTIGKVWCKECVPSCLIEGWSSGYSEIDNFIKDTIYNAKGYNYPLFLKWVSFDRFEDIKKIGEGGFAKVYSAKWIDGPAEYYKQDDGSWKKLKPAKTVALKRLNGSQNMSAEYLNEVINMLYLYIYTQYFILINLNFKTHNSLKHIGVFTTKI